MKITHFSEGPTLFYKRVKINKMIGISLVFPRSMVENSGGKDGMNYHQGIAHLCEHIVLGCPTKTLQKEERLKVKNGFRSSNGGTSFYRVTFGNMCNAKELEEWLSFIVDGITQLNLTPEELEMQKHIVKIERDDKFFEETSVRQMYAETMLPKKYHKQFIDIIGSPEELNAITVDEVYKYIQSTFVKEKMCISVCGNISYRKIVRLLKKYVFSKLPCKREGLFVNVKQLLEESKIEGFALAPKGRSSYSKVICELTLPLNQQKLKEEKQKILPMGLLLSKEAHKFFRQEKNLCYYASLEYDFDYVNNSIKIYIEAKDEDVQKVINVLPEFFDRICHMKPDENRKKYIEKCLQDDYDSDFEVPQRRFSIVGSYIRNGFYIYLGNFKKVNRYIYKHLDKLLEACVARLQELGKYGKVSLCIKTDAQVDIDFKKFKKDIHIK